MLRIAVQSKGRLFEDTMALLSEADIKISTSKRTLLTQASNFPVEVLFLRDDDIPQTIASGVADIGIVGENEFVERNEKADIIYRLGFSKCRLSLAIHKEEPYEGLSWFEGKKIATSYPGILRSFLDKNNIKADIHVITGSVEIAPGIGLADAIFDIVSSGSTLISNNLKEVEVVMKSEAVLIGYPGLSEEKKEILEQLLFRIEAVKAAEDKKYVLMNAPTDDHYAPCYRRLEQRTHRARPKMFLGNHRKAESARRTRHLGITHRKNDFVNTNHHEHHPLS